MERLTFEGNFCDIAQCPNTPGGSFCENGACSQRKVWERLKAYEDTGLMPEEFAAYWAFMQDLIGSQKVSEALSNFRNLVKADRDGRLGVRCGNCKYAEIYQRMDGQAGAYCHCPASIFSYANEHVFTPSRNVDDFCSHGERKEAGEA